MIKLSRSTYYYRKKEKQDARADELLLKAIHKIIEEFPRYGYRRVTKQLHRDGTQVNHKRIYRLMKKHKLLCKQRRKFKVYTTDSNHDYPIYPNLVGGMTITRINQVWVADLSRVGHRLRRSLSCGPRFDSVHEVFPHTALVHVFTE